MNVETNAKFSSSNPIEVSTDFHPIGTIDQTKKTSAANQLAFDFFNSGVGARILAPFQEACFRLWKLRHKNATFADFYAGNIAKHLRRGGSHRTLGSKQFLSGSLLTKPHDQKTHAFSERGTAEFDIIVNAGLLPHHVCVDYGCGSLRVGQHAMAYLDEGKYWGLDIVSDFYDAGTRLLSAELVIQKKPNLRVIANASLREVAALAPDFIFSLAVLRHVPPNELDGYIKKIYGMMGPATQAIINFRETAKTYRVSGSNWFYTRKNVIDSIKRVEPTLEVSIFPMQGNKSKKESQVAYLTIKKYAPVKASFL
jgi:hypothetical protein